MHTLPNMQRQVLEGRLEQQLDDFAMKYFSKSFEECDDAQCYDCLLHMTKTLMTTSDVINGEKKLFISRQSSLSVSFFPII